MADKRIDQLSDSPAATLTDLIPVAPSSAPTVATKMTLQKVKVLMQGTQTFANNAARTAAVPDFIGQIGWQIDTKDEYVSTGTSAGNWILSIGYKQYIVTLNQAGTAAPTVMATLKNNIGAIVWTRDSQGIYLATLASAFTYNKTLVFTSGYNPSFNTICAPQIVDTNQILLAMPGLDGTPIDDSLNGSQIEIRVYN